MWIDSVVHETLHSSSFPFCFLFFWFYFPKSGDVIVIISILVFHKCFLITLPVKLSRPAHIAARCG